VVDIAITPPAEGKRVRIYKDPFDYDIVDGASHTGKPKKDDYIVERMGLQSGNRPLEKQRAMLHSQNFWGTQIHPLMVSPLTPRKDKGGAKKAISVRNHLLIKPAT